MAGRRRHARRGFTLLELLVVMVIIGLLVGYVAPNYFSAVGKSETKAARAQMDSLQKALVAYRLDVGRYPDTLEALHVRPTGVRGWQGPYMAKAIPPDPWGHSYVYRQPGQQGEYDLLSYGRDGRPGGVDDAADIRL